MWETKLNIGKCLHSNQDNKSLLTERFQLSQHEESCTCAKGPSRAKKHPSLSKLEGKAGHPQKSHKK